MGDDSAKSLEEAIDRYNEAWNSHDLDAIMAMHAPDMVFENHTAGESAGVRTARKRIGSIFETWPDIQFEDPEALRPRRRRHPGMDRDAPRMPTTMRRGDLEAAPTGKKMEMARRST